MRVSGRAAFTWAASPEGPPVSCGPAPFVGAAGTSSGRTRPRMTAIRPSSPMETRQPARARSSGEYSARASTAASMASMRSASRRSSCASPAQSVSCCVSASSRAFETVELGPLGVGRHRGRRMHPSEARGGAPVRIEHRLGPLPVARELVGGHAQALHGEVREELRVLEPQPLAFVVGEEVAVERAARGLVSLHAHEAGERRGPPAPGHRSASAAPARAKAARARCAAPRRPPSAARGRRSSRTPARCRGRGRPRGRHPAVPGRRCRGAGAARPPARRRRTGRRWRRRRRLRRRGVRTLAPGRPGAWPRAPRSRPGRARRAGCRPCPRGRARGGSRG